MPSLTDRARKRLLPTAGLSALLTALALSSSPALASTTYSCTRAVQNVPVPSGKVSATITLSGAAGRGNRIGVVSGGRGDSVTISLPVSPGQNLGLRVGCQDGFGGGGGTVAAGNGYGNGGGASTISVNGTLYAVAGGGGGAGGQAGNPAQSTDYGAGGGGGNADSTGGNGTSGGNSGFTDPAAYAGQGGASGSAGGQGGQGGSTLSPFGNGFNGGAGASLQGGTGGGTGSPGNSELWGGGGGGGYIGGGGGGGGSMYRGYDGGGGGGGGSSYVNTAGGATKTSAAATVTGDGSATIAYYASAVMLSPNSVEFGKVLSTPGHSSTQTVTLIDIGSGSDGPVTLGTVHIGAGGSTFAIASDNCSAQTLTAGQSCTVAVIYTPAPGSETDESSTLVFASDSVSGDLTAQLHATAILPADMAVTPSSHSLDFGALATASTRTLNVAVYNTGDQRLNLSAPSITGADADEFAVQQNLCPGTLAAGGSCTMQVQFAPSRVSAAQATLRLTSTNAYSNPTLDVALSGTGTTPAPLPTGPQGPAGTNGTGATGVDGTNGAKGDTGATGPSGTPAKAAALSAVALRSRTLSVCLGCRSTGLLLSYKLARAGDVQLTMQRKTADAWRPVGSRTVAASAGRHELALGNTFAGHKLRGGTYRLVVQTQNGKSSSKGVTLRFRIVTSRAGAVSIR
ncbi:MAG TPA: choice-of-anchor D domain-containing protein [Baekduia sp.]|nr:choice-of-anchor D domain-containing protein [Baekduia sp.]